MNKRTLVIGVIIVIIIIAGLVIWALIVPNLKPPTNLQSQANANAAAEQATVTNTVAASIPSTWTVFTIPDTDPSVGYSFAHPTSAQLTENPQGLDDEWQFDFGDASYSVTRSVIAITNAAQRKSDRETAEGKSMICPGKFAGQICYLQSSTHAVTYIEVSGREFQIEKNGPDGSGIGPSTTEDDTYRTLVHSFHYYEQQVVPSSS